jgi:hypothetical protein
MIKYRDCVAMLQCARLERRLKTWVGGMGMADTHKALVFGQKHGYAGIDLANSQGHQHFESSIGGG